MSHAAGDAQISPLIKELSSYIAGALKRKLPKEVAERAKLHMVDTFAAMISGSRLIPGKRAAAYARMLRSKPEAGVVGTRTVVSALDAALINGIFGHADETDDVHPPTRSHPGVSILPASLAMAEREKASGELLLRAMVLGYDISSRFLLCVGQQQLVRKGIHPGSKGGLFGSAAAAAGLLKLNANQVRHVLSYTAEQAAGLVTVLRDSEHNLKAYVQGGMPAHNGCSAAQMVAAGFTGVDDTLTGEANIIDVLSETPNRDELVRGLGREYEIMRAGIKFWAAGGPIQGPLHVMRDLMQQHNIKADDVVKVVARMPDKELQIVDSRDMPDISVQHLLAVMLIDGTTTFASTHDFKRVRDPKVVRLKQCIETVGDPSLTDPLRSWRCAMEITLKGGRTVSHQTMAAPGSPSNPLTRKDEEEKALDLLAPIMGKKRALALIDALFNVERIKNARDLRKLYAA